MTDDELAAIEQRCEAAAPGPWVWDNPTAARGEADRLICVSPIYVHGSRDRHVSINPILTPRSNGDRAWIEAGEPGDMEDDEMAAQAAATFDLIAHARDDIPALLAEVRRLRAEIDNRE